MPLLAKMVVLRFVSGHYFRGLALNWNQSRWASAFATWLPSQSLAKGAGYVPWPPRTTSLQWKLG